GMGDGGVSVKKEANKCLSDIAVGKDIGIELKKDLHRKKDIDRLKGQIHGYLQEYQYILVVLVGEPSEDAWYNLERELKSLGGGGFSMQNTTIEVIDKGHNKQQSKKEDGWGFI
ncbi:MAG: hypothetical protein U9M95_06465, partial [Candidatus Altiarchaeota archaeon]|nr:hypothetical protein [Candidatus Altiarchaeota archaeon]